MKKQFTIKAVQTSKNIALAAAKNETANLLKFVAGDGECCPWLARIQGQGAKPAFSL